MKNISKILLLLLFLSACAPPRTVTIQPAIQASATAVILPTGTFTPTSIPPTETSTPVPPAETSSPTPIAVVDSLKAKVTADLLSCRYGPGSEYLYLFAFRKGANIKLIGRTDGNNWLMVDNDRKCWINAKFVDIQGDQQTLKIVYPDGYKLPASPYYAPTTVLSASRDPNNPNEVTVTWQAITLIAGDQEDENMFIYIIEVWRCEDGRMIFDPLATNYPAIRFVDEEGCNTPSHGRVYFQEKHGYAGPAEIPWPVR
ncbi:MAG: hypothetical protein K8S20_00620 [Chloroflexi bacterium]|nr:hypothetical protein [Chloroflexota bacterium]